MTLQIKLPQSQTVRFDLIKIGGLCLYNGKLYMRIVQVHGVNTCNLTGQCQGWIDLNALVQPMEGTLTVTASDVLPPAGQVTADDVNAYHAAVRAGNSGKIYMIKSIRERLHCGLREAKDLADAECFRLGLA